MATINIYACERTPSYDALEAVAKHIRRNKNNGSYAQEHEITVNSGLVIHVREHEIEDQDHPCNASFSLVMVDKAK